MIQIEGVGKSFGRTKVLDGVNLRVAPGEVVSILAVSYTHLTLPTKRIV